jgi:lysyl-tRNA synthetase class 2
MSQCEEMIFTVANNMDIVGHCSFRNKKINLTPPWGKITVQEAFEKYAPVNLEEALIADKFNETLVDYIEPRLGIDKPTFLYDYPAKLASLAKLKKGDPSIGERFELYIGGMEIANGFSELTDANEQRKRFEEASRARAQKKWANYPLPEKFLNSLRSLPTSAGIALGIDRLVMILANTATIDEVVAFPPEVL